MVSDSVWTTTKIGIEDDLWVEDDPPNRESKEGRNDRVKLVSDSASRLFQVEQRLESNVKSIHLSVLESLCESSPFRPDTSACAANPDVESDIQCFISVTQ